jgi:hypothetical protein
MFGNRLKGGDSYTRLKQAFSPAGSGKIISFQPTRPIESLRRRQQFMKFLVITRIRDTFVMVPPERQAQIMDGVTSFVNKYRKSGVCKEIFTVASIHGTASVWEVDSAEKGAALFLEDPAYPFEDVEMYAVSDFDAQMKAEKEIYQKLLAKK